MSITLREGIFYSVTLYHSSSGTPLGYEVAETIAYKHDKTIASMMTSLLTCLVWARLSKALGLWEGLCILHGPSLLSRPSSVESTEVRCSARDVTRLSMSGRVASVLLDSVCSSSAHASGLNLEPVLSARRTNAAVPTEARLW